jgi:hypothetical protein
MFFDFSAIKKSLQSLESRLSDLRAEKFELRKKREAIQYAPASKEDVKQRVAKWVTDAGAAFTQDLFIGAKQFAQSPHMRDAGRLQSLATFNGAPGSRLDDTNNPKELGQAMCALLGPLLIESLMKSIDAMEWPQNAIPLANRTEEMEALDKQIGKLQKEESDIITKAKDAGINLG